jgi:hypothetical protein
MLLLIIDSLLKTITQRKHKKNKNKMIFFKSCKAKYKWRSTVRTESCSLSAIS